MTFSIRTLYLFALVLFLGPTGCNGMKSDQPALPLEKTSWTHITANLKPELKSGDHAATLMIKINEDGTHQVSGNGGCNRYHGGVAIKDTSFSVGPLASTKMRCPVPENLMNYELWYHQQLGEVRSWSISGDQLMLKNKKGDVVLMFAGSKPE